MVRLKTREDYLYDYLLNLNVNTNELLPNVDFKYHIIHQALPTLIEEELTEKQQKVFKLYLQGYSQIKIAEIVKTSQSAICNTLRSIRGTLNNYLYYILKSYVFYSGGGNVAQMR